MPTTTSASPDLVSTELHPTVELPAADQRINGIRLYCEEHGSGAPILCIHGAGSMALVWADAVDKLARLGRVIAYDRRGCARSERPQPYERTSVAEHADDAAALLDVLATQPAVVVGRSYGGTIATDLARQGVDAVAAALICEVAGKDAWRSFPDEIRQMLTENGPAILAELEGEWWLQADAAELATIQQPALLVAAADSPPEFHEPVEALARSLPNARTALAGGGHLIDPAAPEVIAFIEEVYATPCGSAPSRPTDPAGDERK